MPRTICSPPCLAGWGWLRNWGSEFRRRWSSVLRHKVRLGADLDASTGVVVVLQLQIVEVAVPRLIRQTAIPISCAELPRTQVADFLAVSAIPPGVQLRICGGFGDLVAGNVDVCVRRNTAARIMLTRCVAVRGICVGHVGIDSRAGGAAEIAMVGAVRGIGAGRRGAVEA